MRQTTREGNQVGPIGREGTRTSEKKVLPHFHNKRLMRGGRGKIAPAGPLPVNRLHKKKNGACGKEGSQDHIDGQGDVKKQK